MITDEVLEYASFIIVLLAPGVLYAIALLPSMRWAGRGACICFGLAATTLLVYGVHNLLYYPLAAATLEVATGNAIGAFLFLAIVRRLDRMSPVHRMRSG